MAEFNYDNNHIRICKKHGKTNFAIENSNLKYKRFRCKLCRQEAVSIRRRKTKEILVDFLGGKCEFCGYNKSIKALEFHHKNPSEKEFNISKKGCTISIKKLKKEAKKCLLLCANCHREQH